jgi:hypothetical protein
MRKTAVVENLTLDGVMQAPEPNPFTEVLNNTQKYVASTTLTEPFRGSTPHCWRATSHRGWGGGAQEVGGPP